MYSMKKYICTVTNVSVCISIIYAQPKPAAEGEDKPATTEGEEKPAAAEGEDKPKPEEKAEGNSLTDWEEPCKKMETTEPLHR